MAIFIDNLRDKIKMYNYYKERDDLLRKSIANIGEIVEEEDKIVCNVSQELFDKYRRENMGQVLRLNGIGTFLGNSDREALAKNYNLEKPVYYIFDNIIFDPYLNFSSQSTNIIFKNCTFYKGISIQEADNVTFENNIYLDYYSGYYYGGDCFLWGRNIKKLTFSSDNFRNSEANHPTKFGMDIDCDVLEIKNTFFEVMDLGKVNINAKETIIKGSYIYVDKLDIDSDSIETIGNNFILALTSINIKNKDNNFIASVHSPVVIYNGIDFAYKNGEMCKVIFIDKKIRELKMQLLSILDFVKENKDWELFNARKTLLGTLYNVEEQCNMMNEKRIQYVKKTLDKQSVCRVLSRDNYRI